MKGFTLACMGLTSCAAMAQVSQSNPDCGTVFPILIVGSILLFVGLMQVGK